MATEDCGGGDIVISNSRYERSEIFRRCSNDAGKYCVIQREIYIDGNLSVGYDLVLLKTHSLFIISGQKEQVCIMQILGFGNRRHIAHRLARILHGEKTLGSLTDILCVAYN